MTTPSAAIVADEEPRSSASPRGVDEGAEREFGGSDGAPNSPRGDAKAPRAGAAGRAAVVPTGAVAAARAALWGKSGERGSKKVVGGGVWRPPSPMWKPPVDERQGPPSSAPVATPRPSKPAETATVVPPAKPSVEPQAKSRPTKPSWLPASGNYAPVSRLARAWEAEARKPNSEGDEAPAKGDEARQELEGGRASPEEAASEREDLPSRKLPGEEDSANAEPEMETTSREIEKARLALSGQLKADNNSTQEDPSVAQDKARKLKHELSVTEVEARAEATREAENARPALSDRLKAKKDWTQEDPSVAQDKSRADEKLKSDGSKFKEDGTQKETSVTEGKSRAEEDELKLDPPDIRRTLEKSNNLLADMESANDDREALRLELEEARRLMTRTKGERDELQAEKESMWEETLALRGELYAARSSLSQVETERDQLRAENETMQEEASTLRDEAKNKDAELAKLKCGLRDVHGSLGESNELLAKWEAANEKCKVLRWELDEARGSAAVLREERDELRTANETMQKEASALRDELEIARASLTDVEREWPRFEEGMESMRAEMLSLQGQVEAKEAVISIFIQKLHEM
ncbi:hypothetical protein ACHAWF_007743 [Thalassiosira exigua]